MQFKTNGLHHSHVSRRFWSQHEREVMVKMFADNYTVTVSQILNRSYGCVCNKANLMGLKKSDSFMKMELERQGQRLRVVGIKSRFSKGHEPENKGKPMHSHVYAKCKATMIKKGHEPHNTKYDGHKRISKDGYIEIRVTKGKYVFEHRHIWEQVNGKVPKGFILVFKDRNPKNITLENIELISWEENMKRNTINRFPSELKSTIRLVNKLKRTIHEKQN